MRHIYINKVWKAAASFLPFYFFTFLPLLALLPLFASCDNIAEGDRYIEVKQDKPDPQPTPDVIVKNVLLEDFTGQRCSNCPLGTEIVEELQGVYGDRFVAVAIHGGPLGFKGTATVMGLATDLGDEYYNHWSLGYQPIGLIDRGTPTNYPDWSTAVRKALDTKATVKMELQATLNGSNIDISVKETPAAPYSGKLQVWLLEDGIVGLQTQPDGSNKRDYVHNHVLRTAVNGHWGQDVTLATGEQLSQTFTQAVDAKWDSSKLSVVAFLYNDSGVEQVVKAAVK